MINKCEGFQWDEGDAEKNWIKHKVSRSECEEVFFNRPLVLFEDVKHSTKEKRYYVLGQTDYGRLLFIAFTIREKKIRIISVRDMSQKERKCYQNEIQKST